MKVGAKLGLGFLVVVLLIWATVFFAGNTYSNIDEEFQLLREDIVPGAIAMSEMEMAANEAAHELIDYVINGDEESKQITLSATEDLERLGLEHLEHETHIGQEEQKVAEELMVKIDTFTGAVVELISLKEQGVSTDELLRKEDEAIHPALVTLLEQVREHNAVHMEELAEAEEAVHEAQTTGVQLLFLIAGLTTLFAAAVAFFVVRSIVNPLRVLHKGTEVIGQGNLDYKVGTNARDEIGQLSRAFDQMTKNLAKTTTSIDNLNKEITERKRAEEEVTAEKKKLEDILETMIDGVTITDMQGRITYINKAATLQLGYTSKESIGKTPGEIFVDEQDVPKFVEYVKAAASGKQMAAEEYLSKRKDGTRFVASTNLSVLKDSKGNPYQIIAVHRDITVRKRAEEALRESEEKFRTFVDTASDLTNIADKDGYLTDVNKAMARVLGYSKKELIGMHITQLLTKEALERDFKPNWERFTKRGEISLDTTYATKDGKEIYGELKAVAVYDSDGKYVGSRAIFHDITERKQAEHNLTERVKELECLYGIAAIAEKSEITLNELCQEVANLLPSSWQYPEICCARITIEDKEFRTANYRDTKWKLCSDIKVGGVKAGAVEVNYLEERPELDEGPFLREERQLIDAVAVQMRGIIEHKQAEETIEAERNKLQIQMEAMVDGVTITDVGGNFIQLNEAVAKMQRYKSAKELIGKPFFQLLSKKDIPRITKVFTETLKKKESVIRNFEVTLKRKDGSEYPVVTNIRNLFDKEGNLIYSVSVLRDITEHKQAEEKLRESEGKYRAILENIEDGYFEVDFAGNFTFVNDSLCKIGGYTGDEMLGMNNRQYMDKKTAKRVYQIFNQVYIAGKPIKEFDWEIIRKDGTKRFVDGSVSLIRDAQGKRIGFRGIVRDITERKEMEAEKKILEQRAQLTSRLNIVGKMASGILHEMNNPLTSVIGFAQLLAQQDLPEDAREYARIINNEGHRAANIAGKIVDFARHEKPEKVYADINQLIESTLELQAYEMEVANIKFTTQLDPHLPRTTADVGQLQQVFLNIILNAKTEMQSAHGKGKFLVKTEAIDNTIRISFEDDGPGIAKENLEKIFEPFFTTKEVNTATGLGLSVCHEIIANHNGQIYARSTLGKGATFTIELPVVARQRKTATTARANASTVWR